MFLWDYLKDTSLPVLIYGMGNGAEKILDLCSTYGVAVSGIFASSDHARNNSFCGYQIFSIDNLQENYPEAVILPAFGVYREDILQRIESLSQQYTVLVPDLPLLGGNILTPEALESRQDEFSSAQDLLVDEKSKAVFDSMLEAKLTGFLKPHFREDTPRNEDMLLLNLSTAERYLDLGAYNGDTISEFLSITDGNYAYIDAMEPDAHNFKKLQAYTNGMRDVTLWPYASWDSAVTLTFSGKGGRNCAMKPELPGKYAHLHPVEAISVDSLKKDFSYVKMDVEGAEAETLMGMKETLSRCHPKLCISAYHKPDDFITLPLLLEQLCPGYRIYMRRNRCLPAWEIQLYCIYPE